MKKEMSIILISFRSILNYKSSVLLLMLQASIQIMISVFLWTYIYQSNQINIAGYDFTSMVQYYLGTIIFSYFVFYPVDWEINDDVHSGNFFSILIKPVTFYKYYFCKMLGDRLAHLLFIIIPVILFSSVYYKNELLTIEILILGSIAIILSMVLWFLISCCVGMLSFWLENSKNKHFIRLCIIDKKINVAIGTIELFQRRSEDYYNGKAIMRLDLRSDYEKSKYIKNILQLIIPHIYTICHSDFVTIKIPVFANERSKAIEDLDFKSEEEYLIGTDGTQYGHYYTKKVNYTRQ